MVSKLGEFGCTPETGRAAPNDRYAEAAFFSGHLQNGDAVCCDKISRVTLEAPDLDRLVFVSEHAGSLTKDFGGANARATRA